MWGVNVNNSVAILLIVQQSYGMEVEAVNLLKLWGRYFIFG
jgi:hypothetical protein